jgi:hypothetical protein
LNCWRRYGRVRARFTAVIGALVDDAQLGAAPSRLHGGEVVVPEVRIDGVVTPAPRTRRGRNRGWRIAEAEFAAVGLDRIDRAGVHHLDRHADELAVARDLAADIADSQLAPVLGGDVLGGVVERDRAMRQRGQRVLGEDLVLGPEDRMMSSGLRSFRSSSAAKYSWMLFARPTSASATR